VGRAEEAAAGAAVGEAEEVGMGIAVTMIQTGHRGLGR
jgi:hypothetical protein